MSFTAFVIVIVFFIAANVCAQIRVQRDTTKHIEDLPIRQIMQRLEPRPLPPDNYLKTATRQLTKKARPDAAPTITDVDPLPSHPQPNIDVSKKPFSKKPGSLPHTLATKKPFPKRIHDDENNVPARSLPAAAPAPAPPRHPVPQQSIYLRQDITNDKEILMHENINQELRDLKQGNKIPEHESKKKVMFDLRGNVTRQQDKPVKSEHMYEYTTESRLPDNNRNNEQKDDIDRDNEKFEQDADDTERERHVGNVHYEDDLKYFGGNGPQNQDPQIPWVENKALRTKAIARNEQLLPKRVQRIKYVYRDPKNERHQPRNVQHPPRNVLQQQRNDNLAPLKFLMASKRPYRATVIDYHEEETSQAFVGTHRHVPIDISGTSGESGAGDAARTDDQHFTHVTRSKGQADREDLNYDIDGVSLREWL